MTEADDEQVKSGGISEVRWWTPIVFPFFLSFFLSFSSSSSPTLSNSSFNSDGSTKKDLSSYPSLSCPILSVSSCLLSFLDSSDTSLYSARPETSIPNQDLIHIFSPASEPIISSCLFFSSSTPQSSSFLTFSLPCHLIIILESCSNTQVNVNDFFTSNGNLVRFI